MTSSRFRGSCLIVIRFLLVFIYSVLILFRFLLTVRLLFCFLFLFFAANGPGPYSLERWIGHRPAAAT